MKKSIIYALAALVLAACSTPKYAYKFSEYDYSSGKKKLYQPESINGVASNLSDISSPVELSSEKDHRSVMTLDGALTLADNPVVEKKQLAIARPENLKESKKEQKNAIKREIKAAKKEWKEKAIKQSADSSKNGFAIAGFVCSIVGLFVLWPLCVVGLILSAIGLKSERKGLAIAGLVIGIVGVVLVLAAGAALAAA